MTKEELNEMSIEDIQKNLTKELDEYNVYVKTLGLDEVKEEEAKLMDLFKENDEYIKTASYVLPEELELQLRTEVPPVKRKFKDIADDIVTFLNTIDNEWRTTAGTLQLIYFWKYGKKREIPYGILDSTLRVLGSVIKYRGERDLEKITQINNYLSTVHESYVRDNIYIQYLSSKHQSLMNQMQELEKEETPKSNVVQMQ